MMRNGDQLKEKLQALAQNDFRLSEKEDVVELIPDMLYHIGSIDPVLRDDLIYSAFGTWILHHNAIEPEQLRSLLSVVLDDQHLLYHLGEQDTDSVFTRSFSVLILPLLLIAHRSNHFLTAQEIYQIKEKLLHYLENEKDRRGYVSEKGWAHAVAHTSDALDDLAQCPELKKADLVEILEAIRKAICVTDTGYIHLEDERAVTAVIAVLRREMLPELEISNWVLGFADQALAVKSLPDRLVIRSNVKNFLQSLYFRLMWEKLIGSFEAPIRQTLLRINPFKPSEDA